MRSLIVRSSVGCKGVLLTMFQIVSSILLGAVAGAGAAATKKHPPQPNQLNVTYWEDHICSTSDNSKSAMVILPRGACENLAFPTKSWMVIGKQKPEGDHCFVAGYSEHGCQGTLHLKAELATDGYCFNCGSEEDSTFSNSPGSPNANETTFFFQVRSFLYHCPIDYYESESEGKSNDGNTE